MSGIAETYGSGFVNTQNPNSQQRGDLSTGGGLGNSRLAYSGDSTALYGPLADPAQPDYQPGNGGSGSGSMENIGSVDPVKRKRGRPRKYVPDGGVGIGLGSPPSGGLVSPPTTVHSGGLLSLPGGDSGTPVGGKRGRGRPPGSSNRPKVPSNPPALGNAGNGWVAVGFTPHLLTVKAGEDLSAKIMALSQNGPRSICILSASGSISNVTLNQASISGGTVTYEGRFDILSLSGSFLLSESGGQRSRTGGLSVLLAGPDGHVLGGCVAGLLIAASPVQVIVCTFILEGQKEKIHVNSEPLNAPSKFTTDASAGGSPISRGAHSESPGVPVSPLSHNSTGACNNSMSQGMVNMLWK